MPETLLPTEALPLPDFPAMPEPAVLKHPEDGEYDDDTAVKWAWFAHGYDTGMEPFFSAEQVKELMRAYGESVRAALTAAPAGIPEGWQLVPKVMTPEMDHAVLHAHDGYSYPQDFVEGPKAMRRAEWNAALSAVPVAAPAAQPNQQAVSTKDAQT